MTPRPKKNTLSDREICNFSISGHIILNHYSKNNHTSQLGETRRSLYHSQRSTVGRSRSHKSRLRQKNPSFKTCRKWHGSNVLLGTSSANSLIISEKPKAEGFALTMILILPVAPSPAQNEQTHEHNDHPKRAKRAHLPRTICSR